MANWKKIIPLNTSDLKVWISVLAIALGWIITLLSLWNLMPSLSIMAGGIFLGFGLGVLPHAERNDSDDYPALIKKGDNATYPNISKGDLPYGKYRLFYLCRFSYYIIYLITIAAFSVLIYSLNFEALFPQLHFPQIVHDNNKFLTGFVVSVMYMTLNLNYLLKELGNFISKVKS